MTIGSRETLLVAAGSTLGSAARWLCTVGMLSLLGPAWPWGTLLVNTLGSFLIGFTVRSTDPHTGRFRLARETRLFLTAGFFAGFTTLSIFSLESLQLVRQGATPAAATYVLISLSLWLGAAWAGLRLATRLCRGHNAS